MASVKSFSTSLTAIPSPPPVPPPSSPPRAASAASRADAACDSMPSLFVCPLKLHFRSCPFPSSCSSYTSSTSPSSSALSSNWYSSSPSPSPSPPSSQSSSPSSSSSPRAPATAVPHLSDSSSAKTSSISLMTDASLLKSAFLKSVLLPLGLSSSAALLFCPPPPPPTTDPTLTRLLVPAPCGSKEFSSMSSGLMSMLMIAFRAALVALSTFPPPPPPPAPFFFFLAVMPGSRPSAFMTLMYCFSSISPKPSSPPTAESSPSCSSLLPSLSFSLIL
mmetsp:Transcript_21040/g.39401  ORF Transcript_21040/g.39401 Transcript_21040/m.39401 type:complete len:276 (-) Transcript_21040:2674-3501(-)